MTLRAKTIAVPPEPGIRPEYLAGEPATAAEVLRPHARGRAVWEVCYSRFALREALRLLDLAPGDEVLMPAFCCTTVSAPIAAIGAAPLYYRVGYDALPDWDDAAKKARSPRVRALIAVHYLGFPADLSRASAICREHGLILIEDCAHALFSAAGRKPVGRTADLAAFSFYKMMPVAYGAVLTVNTKRFPTPPPAPPEPGPETERGQHIDAIAQRLAAYDRGVRFGQPTVDIPARDRQLYGTRDLYAARTEPHALGRSTKLIMGHAVRRSIVTKRRTNYAYLLAKLRDWGLFKALPGGVCPLGFPVLVADQQAVKDGLQAAGIGYLIHWSRKILPGAAEAFPEVAFLTDHVMTLPCHQDLGRRHLDYLSERFVAIGVPPAVPPLGV